MKQLMGMLVLVAGLVSVSMPALARDAQTIFNQYCTACHISGAAGAPKAHDVAAWQPRLAKGKAVLLADVKKGFKAMPPKGMCMDCTDAELSSTIDFMARAKK